MRVLVVDSGIMIPKVVELSLRGADVSSVKSLQEAKAAIAAQRPDIVIASIALPDGDAYDLCKSAQCGVILLRGASEPFDEQKARNAGAHEILGKPFNPADLLSAVERVSARRR